VHLFWSLLFSAAAAAADNDGIEADDT